MARTNAANVQEILGGTPAANSNTNWDGITSMTPFIAAASVVTDRVAACAIEEDATLTDAELELVERWLAAHFYQQMDKGYASRSTAGGSGSFQSQTGMHLESTLYGQTAMVLDSSGCLRAQNAGGQSVASVVWLGKEPSAQINVWDRS